MNTVPSPPETILRQLRAALQREWAHLQIVVRALMPNELRRSEVISWTIPLLDEVLAILEAG
jgi:hypothetical protein